jgi:hypothetical protein
MIVIFLKFEELKNYLETEIDKALSELKDDKNNVELHSRFRTFLEILAWIEGKEREERNEKFPTDVEIKG